VVVPQRTGAYIALVAAAVIVVLGVFAVARRYGAMTATAPTGAARAPSPAPAGPPGRKIKARLFYVNDDGARLTSVEREIAYGENTADQAREIVTAQLAAVARPLVSAVPAGTQLRALFITDKGEAFVDLSREVAAAHPGGTVNELLTVYTLVNALTANLPAVTSVQLLVDGREVETLAGHVNLRRPLARNPGWVQ
jgi:spore germination protein GerM